LAILIDEFSVLSGGLNVQIAPVLDPEWLNVECALSCYRRHDFRFEMTAAGTVDEMLAVKCRAMRY